MLQLAYPSFIHLVISVDTLNARLGHRGPKRCISDEHNHLIVIYLCSCAFLSRFGTDLNQSERRLTLQLSNIILFAVS